jgi:hypothetical protein
MGTLFPFLDGEVLETQTKVCIYCKKEKHLSEFYKHPSRYDRLDGRCIECHQKRHILVKKLKASAPPPPEFCECCGGRNIDINHKQIGLACDHDPLTDTFRGWLCKKCNTAIGQLGDSLDGVMNAVKYLSKEKK